MTLKKTSIALAISLLSVVGIFLYGSYHYLSKKSVQNIANTFLGVTSQQEEVTLPLKQYTHPQGFYGLNYPADWSVYEVKGQDNSLGGVNIVPQNGAEGLNKRVIEPEKYQGIEEQMISVEGSLLYSFDNFNTQQVIQFLEEQKEMVEKQSDTDIRYFDIYVVDKEGIPALVYSFENKKFSTRGVGKYTLAKNSASGNFSPIVFSVTYQAKKENFSEYLSKKILESFREDIVAVSQKIEEEKSKKENADNRSLGLITSEPFLSAGRPLIAKLEDWGTLGSVPVSEGAVMENILLSGEGQKRNGIKIELSSLDSYGLFRSVKVPKDAYMFDFCFMFPEVGEADQLTVYLNEDIIFNFSPYLAQEEAMNSQIALLGVSPGEDDTLSVLVTNRSGQKIKGWFTDFRFITPNEMGSFNKKSKDCQKTKY